jgi:hypothetical protein
MGGFTTQHSAAGSPGPKALAGLQTPGVSAYLTIKLYKALAETLPHHAAHLWPQVCTDTGIPPSDAAAPAAAQAASEQAQRTASLLRSIQPAAQQSAALPPADMTWAHGSTPPPLPPSSTAVQEQPALVPQSDTTRQHKLLALLPVVAMLSAQYLYSAQTSMMHAARCSPGLRALRAGHTALPAAAAATLDRPATTQGGAGIAKKCRLCQQLRRATHQHGCPTHCKQLNAECSCRA